MGTERTRHMYLLKSLIKQLWCLGSTRWAICKVVRLVGSPQVASSWFWPHATSTVLPNVALSRNCIIFSVLYFLGSVLCQISKCHICNIGLIIIWFSNFDIAHSVVFWLLSFLKNNWHQLSSVMFYQLRSTWFRTVKFSPNFHFFVFSSI